MRNKKLSVLTGIITTSLLLFTACGNKTEPVSAEPTETVSEVDTEESEDSSESMEPVPSPTVEPTEEPVEESVENSESEVDTSEAEESSGEESPEESTSIEIVEELDLQMYAQQNCNSRSGDGTNYDKVASIEKGAQLHVTGRTSNDWYRVEWGEGVVYIAGSLLGDKAPSSQQSSGGNGGSSGGNGNLGGSGGGSSQPTEPTPPPAQDEPQWNVGDVMGENELGGNDMTYGGVFDPSQW